MCVRIASRPAGGVRDPHRRRPRHVPPPRRGLLRGAQKTHTQRERKHAIHHAHTQRITTAHPLSDPLCCGRITQQQYQHCTTGAQRGRVWRVADDGAVGARRGDPRIRPQAAAEQCAPADETAPACEGEKARCFARRRTVGLRTLYLLCAAPAVPAAPALPSHACEKPR